MLLKFKSALTTGLVFILAIILTFSGFPMGASAQIRPVTVAPGFEFSLFADTSNISEFASGPFAGPTAIAFDSRGRLFVATFSGKIFIMLDNNEDGRADEIRTFAKSIPTPLGLEFHANGDLYATSNIPGGVGRILRLRDIDGDDSADEVSVIVDGLPSEGDHQTDRLKFGPDGLLYFGQGSSTDNGTAKPGRPVERQLNASMLRVNLNNPVVETVATGLRNPFGMAFHPENGSLFSTDGGSGEVCQGGPNCPPEDLSPPEEVNWVVPGGNYGFPQCEGSPTTEPPCSGVRAPMVQYPAHLTPTSLCFYTGPQAGAFRNQLLLTLYKNLPNFPNNYGGDLRRIIVEGNPTSGFTLRDDGFIAQFDPIDPFDGPLDTAIDPISGDIYVVRFDPVQHRNRDEHHHIIYRIHRAGSDQLPFIGLTNPRSVVAGSGAVSLALVGRHLSSGAIVLADGQPLTTRQGATRFDLIADLTASMTSSQRTIKITVRNADNSLSNEQTFTVRNGSDPDPDPDPPAISSFFVFKKKRNKPVNPVRAGIKGKKFKIVVTGENFDTNAELLIRGESVQIDSRTSTEIVGRLTNPMTATAGQLSIQIRNSDGTLSNTLTLTVVGSSNATIGRMIRKDRPDLKGRR